MKIAILSDIHGNKEALEAVLDDCYQLGINQFIFLGDLVMKGPSPKEVYEMIKGLNLICWIRGNTDDWFNEIDEDWRPSNKTEEELYNYFEYAKTRMSKDDIDIIKSTPLNSTVQINDNRILCVHGSPQRINEKMDSSVPEKELRNAINNVTEKIILCGHSHVPCEIQIDDKIIFNVGSIGNPMDDNNEASYGIIDSIGNKISLIHRRVKYNYNLTIQAAIDNKFPNIDKYVHQIKYARI